MQLRSLGEDSVHYNPIQKNLSETWTAKQTTFSTQTWSSTRLHRWVATAMVFYALEMNTWMRGKKWEMLPRSFDSTVCCFLPRLLLFVVRREETEETKRRGIAAQLLCGFSVNSKLSVVSILWSSQEVDSSHRESSHRILLRRSSCEEPRWSCKMRICRASEISPKIMLKTLHSSDACSRYDVPTLVSRFRRALPFCFLVIKIYDSTGLIKTIPWRIVIFWYPTTQLCVL